MFRASSVQDEQYELVKTAMHDDSLYNTYNDHRKTIIVLPELALQAYGSQLATVPGRKYEEVLAWFDSIGVTEKAEGAENDDDEQDRVLLCQRSTAGSHRMRHRPLPPRNQPGRQRATSARTAAVALCGRDDERQRAAARLHAAPLELGRARRQGVGRLPCLVARRAAAGGHPIVRSGRRWRLGLAERCTSDSCGKRLFWPGRAGSRCPAG